jgi:predicted thioesterase
MDFAARIPIGLKDEVVFPVEEAVTAFHIGSGSLRVLATPAMIGFMERVSHKLIARYLPEGYSSVGVVVDVRHLAATPMGASVRIISQVLEVDGRRVTLSVEAWDNYEKVGEGRHPRVIIDLERFLQRVDEKAQRLARAASASS